MIEIQSSFQIANLFKSKLKIKLFQNFIV